MIITKLEESEKSKIKVFIDEEYAFWLYRKEVDEYRLESDLELSNALYEKIMIDTVCRHAKEKALSILKFTDRTENELRRKLADADYSDEIINKAITYVNGYGYLNDERLAATYTRARMNKKSKMVIKNELIQKGVNSQVIDQVLREEYSREPEEEDAELFAIRKAIAKKTKCPEELDYDAKQKLIASLYRKGFEISKIKQILY